MKEIYSLQNRRFKPDFRIQHFIDKDLPTFKDINDDNEYEFPTTKNSNLNSIFRNNFISKTERPLQSQETRYINNYYQLELSKDRSSDSPEVNNKSERSQINKIQPVPVVPVLIGQAPSSSSSNPNSGIRPPSSRIAIPDDDRRLYQKPDYDEGDERKRIYKENKQKVKKRTFNDYNEFDIKNFDVKTDGSLVEYKPEFHKNGVKSNVTFC